MKKIKIEGISRRKFIKEVSLASAAFTIVPRHVLGKGFIPPSDILNIAGIGVGGIGRHNLNRMNSQNIVALCDVDWDYAADTVGEYPDAKKYKDFRKMLEEQKDIDAVVIATPDHTHAVAANMAMKLGKHVYVQKPLTHSVYESRVLTQTAKETGVATQMGNQGNSGEGIRQICEWIWDGAIGEVREAHAWTNRPIWPQGLERPEEAMAIPETLDWNLFIGPAPFRPYHSAYHPWSWRAWWDFGTGALGDMACHIIDPVYKALKLKYPVEVEASSTLLNTESAPQSSKIHFLFPAREDVGKVKMPKVKVTWYDGGIMPERPEELGENEMMGDWGGGALFVGTKGKIICSTYARDPKLLPKSLNESYVRPDKALRRVENGSDGHEMDWVRACKESPENRVEASSNFDYAGPFNEMVVMGNLAVRLQGLRKKLKWDGENMKFTNISETDTINVVKTNEFKKVDGSPRFNTERVELNALEEAEEYIRHSYREGWSL